MIEGSVSVSIIEDSDIHMDVFRCELLEDTRYQIVSTDIQGRSGIHSVKVHQPDIVILDYQLRDMTGLEVARYIKAGAEKTKVFIITAHTENSIVDRIIRDPNVDAIGIKGSSALVGNFLWAVTHVLENNVYIDPSLLKKIRNSNKSSGLDKLTKREFEIFIQTRSGKTDDEIASDLFVEIAHVRNLKSRIAKKIKGERVDDLVSRLADNLNPDPFELSM